MADDPREGSGDEAAAQGGAGLQLDVVRSYLAFAARAIKPRWLTSAAILLIGLLLTGAVLRYIPRTYTCTTVLMAIENPVLDSYGGPSPLAGASTLITRQENVQALVRETGMVQKYVARRPPLLGLKDRVMQSFFGQWSDETMASIVVGTLQSKLSVGSDASGNLAITVDWTDGKTAAELAEAAREGFLRTRHAAEISAFEAKMSILDEHATKMRAEVETLAEQINAAHAERATQASKATSTAVAVAGATAVPSPAAVVAPRRMSSAPAVDLNADLPEQRAKLADKRRQLAELENDRERRLREERAKLAELLLHVTPSHPSVVTEQERIAILSQVPSEVVLLRNEVKDLESTLKQRELMATHVPHGTPTGPVSGGGPAALPTEIIQALESDTTDPALAAQISGAVGRYGALRDDIRAGRMQLDTAQAAFDHRYQIVVPAEVPNVPTKPKPPLIFGVGLALSLLFALLVPIVAELRRGIIIERWQVQQMALPVLAELKLPPHSAD